MCRFAIFFLAMLMSGCSGSRPADLGIRDGKLALCPRSPNCVSSQSKEQSHYIAPVGYQGPLPGARDRLIAVLQGMRRARIVAVQDRYIHAEFTSALFRFIDDAEFYFDDKANILHMRSASRLGYADLGVNRHRLERIKARFRAAAFKSHK